MKFKPPTDYNKPVTEILEGFLRKDWNPYREHFKQLNFPDIVYLNMKFIEIYDRVHGKRVWEDHCFNEEKILQAFQAVFEHCEKPQSILELGAWNGKLAETVFKYYGYYILKWNACDICPSVVTQKRCKHPLYNPILLLGYFWDVVLPPHDIFVCSHVFEHMSFEQVKRVLEHQKAKYLILEIPMKNSWEDFEGGHVLQMTKKELHEVLSRLGYSNLFKTKNEWVTAWVKNAA